MECAVTSALEPKFKRSHLATRDAGLFLDETRSSETYNKLDSTRLESVPRFHCPPTFEKALAQSLCCTLHSAPRDQVDPASGSTLTSRGWKRDHRDLQGTPGRWLHHELVNVREDELKILTVCSCTLWSTISCHGLSSLRFRNRE
jgi:hypothetical protein